ncbi:MAG: DEAD/DEAH box helicase [Prevotellaceae bacterium]|jgi:SWI/SNF-related matrix-associated actin-dependent regulator 1 of chromatin subfamily A|nr:DEAD/DEAH box helicase [Prevotellaceae bacterium]
MRQIVEKSNGFVIIFDYNTRIIEDVRCIPGREYNHNEKHWFIPKRSEKYLNTLRKYGFTIKGGDVPEAFRNFNYKIDEMPELSVNIPLKMDLFPFQRKGVQYILDKKKLIVGDTMGLGKTIQAIAAVVAANAFPCLVICPSSLKINWQREIEMWTTKKAMILSDSTKRTFPYFYESGLIQFFIVNYESLKKYFVERINRRIGTDGKELPITLKDIVFSNKINIFKSVIADESHRVKDLKTQQSKFTRGICRGKEYLLLLTGTPVVNKPKDLISQLGILDRLNEFGGYKNFIQWFCEADNRWRELNVMLRNKCFYRREKSEVLKDLPSKMRQAVICDITTEKEYGDAMNDLQNYLKQYKQATDEQIQRSMRGEIMVRIGILKNISAQGKIDDVVDYVNDVVDSGEKIVLFTHLREVQEKLKKHFPAAVTIFGSDDSATRQRNIDTFQNDRNTQIIICSIKAAGVGITLTASSRVAFVELPWHPADCEQCEDRTHRIGQTNSVQCTYFLGRDTIDEWIYRLINEKRDMSNQITGARNDVEEKILDGLIEVLTRKNQTTK